jgi:translation initiation factor 1
MASLAEMLASNMGSKLESDKFDITLDTTKEDKKSIQKKVNQNSNQKLSKKEHQLVFTFEKRNGKPVTLVGRFYIDENDKKDVLKLLKKKLATGGTIQNEWIEIQGDFKEKIKEILQKENWKFK